MYHLGSEDFEEYVCFLQNLSLFFQLNIEEDEAYRLTNP